jgi:hypothetical protein
MAAGNTYVPITTQTLGSVTASVTFNSFSGYTDLIIVSNARRGITSSGEASFGITLNGDTGSNYSSTLLYEPPGSARLANQSNMGYLGSAGDGANCYNVFHFMNYANTTTQKTVLNRHGYVLGNNITRYAVGLWRSTAAITSITFTPANGFEAGTNFTLYGILAA